VRKLIFSRLIARKSPLGVLFRLMPTPLRRELYLRAMRYDPADLLGITFKVAETRDEREQAFRLLHDAYERRGIIEAHPSGMRVSAFAILPTTAQFIGVRDGRVLCTMSFIEASPLGLPMQEAYAAEIAPLLRSGRRVAEIGALAVAPGQRGRGLALMMYNLMFRWARFHRRVDDFVMVMHPRMADFFRSVMFFRPLGPEREIDSLRAAPAIALHATLDGLEQDYLRTYELGRFADRDPRSPRNLYRFFRTADFENLSLPPVPEGPEATIPPGWSLRDIRYFADRGALDLVDAGRVKVTSRLDRLPVWRAEPAGVA